jgi:hypothetical protein
VLLLVECLALSLPLYLFCLCFILFSKPFHAEAADVFLEKLQFALKHSFFSSSNLAIVNSQIHVPHVQTLNMLYMIRLDVLAHCNGYFFIVSWNIEKLQKIL